MRKLRWILTLSLVLLCCTASALAQGKAAVQIDNLSKEHRDNYASAGMILPTEMDLKGTTKVDLSEMLAMYPNHTGVYGVVVGQGSITVTADNGQSVAGQDRVDFAFPGAAGVSVSGQGKAYGAFLPVQYTRIANGGKTVTQSVPDSCVALTADGEETAFFIADPGMYVLEDLTRDQVVCSYVLGLYGGKLSNFDMENYEAYGIGFAFEGPTLIQIYQRGDAVKFESFTVMAMEKLYSGELYDVWCYAGCSAMNQKALGNICKTMDAAITLTQEQYLMEGLSLDHTVVTVVPGELMEGVDGFAESDAAQSGTGFNNVFYCSDGLLGSSANLTYVFAHEFGHIVHNTAWNHNVIYGTGFVSEGFATYFGEQVCTRLGMVSGEHRHTQSAKNDPFLQLFSQNLQRGFTGSSAYFAARDDALMEPRDCYTFGYYFWKYLHETYGDSCLKQLSAVIMPQVYAERDAGRARWHHVDGLLSYNQDGYFDLFVQAFGEDVFTGFPGWMAKQK